MDPRVEKLAHVVVDYSLRVRPGQLVRIRGNSVALPLMVAGYREVLRAGGHPFIRGVVPRATEILLKEGSVEQLRYVSDLDRMEVERIDADFIVSAETNTREFSGVDPERLRLQRESTGPLLGRRLQRTAEGSLRWCVTPYPTEAGAQEAEMSLPEWEDFVYGAGCLDQPDPVVEWERIREDQDRIVKFLSGVRELRVIGPDTDLVVEVGGRTWVNAAGTENFPDGEVFTGPHEGATRGRVRFTYPAIYGSREVGDVRLWFEDGRVVRAEAGKGDEFLQQMLAVDEGASRVGEFAIGTNRQITRFTRNILFDEKIGGTFHIALGAAYPDTGGLNRSGLHWDMICDLRSGGEIRADGEVIFRDGAFVPGVVG